MNYKLLITDSTKFKIYFRYYLSIIKNLYSLYSFKYVIYKQIDYLALAL
jgi:hypothetical protein